MKGYTDKQLEGVMLAGIGLNTGLPQQSILEALKVECAHLVDRIRD